MCLFVPCAFSSTNNFAHMQTLYRMSSLCRSYECMTIVRVNIGFFTGFKKIKQRRISFVLGYLRMILWKIATAISIKHQILATFNIKKINSDSLYAFKKCDVDFSSTWKYYIFKYLHYLLVTIILVELEKIVWVSPFLSYDILQI